MARGQRKPGIDPDLLSLWTIRDLTDAAEFHRRSAAYHQRKAAHHLAEATAIMAQAQDKMAEKGTER